MSAIRRGESPVHPVAALGRRGSARGVNPPPSSHQPYPVANPAPGCSNLPGQPCPPRLLPYRGALHRPADIHQRAPIRSADSAAPRGGDSAAPPPTPGSSPPVAPHVVAQVRPARPRVPFQERGVDPVFSDQREDEGQRGRPCQHLPGQPGSRRPSGSGVVRSGADELGARRAASRIPPSAVCAARPPESSVLDTRSPPKLTSRSVCSAIVSHVGARYRHRQGRPPPRPAAPAAPWLYVATDRV